MVVEGGTFYFSYPNDSILELLYDNGETVVMLDSIGYRKEDFVTRSDEEVMPQIIPTVYEEGGIGKKVLVNRYERNAQARNRCIELKGSQCTVCGFDSKLVYGEDFKDRIEVHHITPLNEIQAEYQVNPETDLVPVCPNCHMILHTKMSNGEYPTIEFLREMVESKKDGRTENL